MPGIAAPPEAGIPASELRTAVTRVVHSAVFARSGQLQRLLCFLVDETLAGRGGQLKEYVIGVEVFGRPATFDPHLDSLVRVEARRLRGALETYYRTEGHDDPVIIEVHKGGYQPVFRRQALPAFTWPPGGEFLQDTPAIAAPTANAPTVARSPRLPVQDKKRIAAIALTLGACVLLLVIVTALLPRGAPVQALTERDSIVIAGFANSTGETIFDDTLKQGLLTELEQSPFLNILSERRAEQVLRQMRHSPGAPITPEIARELCVRTAGAATVHGSIGRLGSHYVIGLTATNCSTGDALVHLQVEAGRREAVLKALSMAASRLRGRLGEGLSSIQNFQTPVEEATTTSLEALQAYSIGRRTARQTGSPADIPFFKRAIEIDPEFAIAHAALGVSYVNLGEPALAAVHLKKAHDLRDRVTERERCRIAAYYHHVVTGDLAKAGEAYELWIRSYPRDYAPHINLGLTHLWLGQYARALSETQEAARLEPGNVLPYANLAALYIKLGHPDKARSVLTEAGERNLTSRFVRSNLCYLAFLDSDEETPERQLSEVLNRPGEEDLLLSQQSDTEAYYGRLRNARGYSRRAVSAATHAGVKEAAALWLVNAALREAEFGNSAAARRAVAESLRLAAGRDVVALAALASARAGDVERADALLRDLERTYPLNSVIRLYWSPTIRAAVEVTRDPTRGLERLRAVAPYELGSPPPFGLATLYPVYLRGEASLLAHDGRTAMAAFQKIVDHPGLVLNFPLGSLAYLQLGRARALAGRRAEAREAYDRFLKVWENADPGIPILRQARIERARLR